MVTKPSPSKKELIGKIKLMEDEKQILAKKNEEEQKNAKAEYQKIYDENRRLKLQPENLQKNSGKTNYRVRKSGRPKYQPQNVNGQNLNQTRFPMQQHFTQSILNPAAQNAPHFPQRLLQQQHFQHQQMMMMQQPWYYPQMSRSSYFQ
uniref:Uncharacterized protein n=1 Tax=Panagrolaimus davidi TaxID=227884 RepID=A0A914Q3U4_9BILA